MNRKRKNKKTTIITILLLISFLSIIITSPAIAGDLPDWVESEQHKGFMGYSNNIMDTSTLYDHWNKMKDSGVNVTMTKYWKTENYLADIERDGAKASEIGLKLIPSLYLFNYHERYLGYDLGLPSAINGQGLTSSEINTGVKGNKEYYVPCPTDATYWEHALATPATAIATISLNPALNISGINIEPEMYGTGIAFKGFFNIKSTFSESDKKNSGSYCDAPFNEFINTIGIFDTIEKEARHEWLLNNDLLPDYANFLKIKVQTILENILGRVFAINPDLLISAYPGAHYPSYNNWFMNAFNGALSSFNNTLALDASYRPARVLGDLDYFNAEYDYLNLPRVHALWQELWTDQEANMVRSMNLQTVAGPGYWHYIQNAPTESFWERSKFLNDGIDKASELGGNSIRRAVGSEKLKGAFELTPILTGTIPSDATSNLLSEAYQNITIPDASYYAKVIVSIPVSEEEEEYVLSYNIDFTGNHTRARLRATYVKPDGSEDKEYIIELDKEDSITGKRYTGHFKVAAGVSQIVFWNYGFVNPQYREHDISLLTGSTILSNGMLLNSKDITWGITEPINVPETQLLAAELPGNPGLSTEYTTWITETGVLVKAGNLSDILLTGTVWFNSLEGEKHYICDPIQRICIKSPTGSKTWTNAQLSNGVFVNVVPQSARYIMAILNTGQGLPSGFRTVGNKINKNDMIRSKNHWGVQGPSKFVEYLKSPFTSLPTNLLANGSFQDADNFIGSTSWVAEGTDASILNDKTFATDTKSGKDLTIDGDQYTLIKSGSNISQNVTIPAGTTNLKLRGYFRGLRAPTLKINLLNAADQSAIVTQISKKITKSPRIWYYVEIDIPNVTAASDLDAILKIAVSRNQAEVDKLELIVE